MTEVVFSDLSKDREEALDLVVEQFVQNIKKGCIVRGLDPFRNLFNFRGIVEKAMQDARRRLNSQLFTLR
jgi:hypothetical protein